MIRRSLSDHRAIARAVAILLAVGASPLACSAAATDAAESTDANLMTVAATTPAGPTTVKVPQSSRVVNRGGDIISRPALRIILLGDYFAGNPDDLAHWKASLTDLANRPQFYAPLAQYAGRNGFIHPGHLDSLRVEPTHFSNTAVVGTSCDGFVPCARNSDINAAITKYAATDPNDDSSLYAVIVAPGAFLGVKNDLGSVTGGFHNALWLNGKLVRYTISAYDGPDHLETLSHELSEAITDPYPATPGVAQTYFNPEIGDLCEGTSALLDGISVQMEWSERDQKCIGYEGWPELVGGAVTSGDGAADSSFVVAASTGQAGAPPSGQPVLFAVNASNAVEYKPYNGTGDWAAWTQPAQAGWLSRIASVSAPSRSVFDLVGIGGDGNVWWKGALNSLFEGFGWFRIGSFPVRDVAASQGGQGTTLFALGTDGVVRYQMVAPSAVPSESAWLIMTGLPGPATSFAVTHTGDADNAVDVVAAVNGSWPPYLSRGSVFHYSGGQKYMQGGFVPIAGPSFVRPNEIRHLAFAKTGANSPGGARIAVFAATDLGVWFTMDDAHNPSNIESSWGITTLPTTTRQIAVASNGDGRLELFGIDGYDRVWHVRQNSLYDNDWGAAASLGGSVKTIQAFTWPSGEIEVFGVDARTHQIAHDWQISAGGAAWQY